MYDRGLSVLEQYGLTAKTVNRGRGNLLCETQEGWRMICEFGGAGKKLEQQYFLQEHLAESGCEMTDRILKNMEGELVTVDAEGIPYVVHVWYPGKECDTRSEKEILRGISALATLHKAMKMPVIDAYVRNSLLDECLRHNVQLRKIRTFIRKKQQKNTFEQQMLKSMEEFIGYGEKAVEELRTSGYDKLREQALKEGQICHGEYNQHNVLMVGQKTAVTGFEKWNFDMQEADLYHFLRKIMEKHNWNLELGTKMLEAYQKIRPMSDKQLMNLKIRLSYPWKFWKLANYYSSNNKVWISGKNMEKLLQIQNQQKEWLEFLNRAF